MQQQQAVEELMRLAQGLAAAQAERGPPPLGKFRIIMGTLTGLLGLTFLLCNIVILAHFGYRLGNSEVEHYVQAICAGAVPVLMTLIPIIFVSTWTPGHMAMVRGRMKWRRGRPKWAMLAGNVLALFVALTINIAGGIGVMAQARKGVALQAEGSKAEQQRTEYRRNLVKKELDGLPQHRPTDAVVSMLAAHRLHRFWKATDQCNEGSVLNKGHRDYCGEHERLKQEQATAERSGRLAKELAELDAALSSPLTSSLQAGDAQVETIASSTGLSADGVRNGLSILFPLLLEVMTLIGVSTSLHFFRVDHRSIQDVPQDVYVPPVRQLPAPSHISRVLQAVDADDVPVTATPRAVISEDPVRQRAVFDEFWRTRMRRVDSGQVALPTVYSHYEVLCAQRSVTPFDQSTFKRLSATHVRAALDIGGVEFWCHVTIAEG